MTDTNAGEALNNRISALSRLAAGTAATLGAVFPYARMSFLPGMRYCSSAAPAVRLSAGWWQILSIRRLRGTSHQPLRADWTATKLCRAWPWTSPRRPRRLARAGLPRRAGQVGLVRADGSVVLGFTALEDAEERGGNDSCCAADRQHTARELSAAHKVVALRPRHAKCSGGVFDTRGTTPGGADAIWMVRRVTSKRLCLQLLPRCQHVRTTGRLGRARSGRQ